MEYTLSYWERASFFDGVDAAVIGSGIVGLAAAIHLKTLQPRWRVVVLERGLTHWRQHPQRRFCLLWLLTELLDDIQNSTEDAVLAVVERRWRGLQRLRQLVGDARLDFRQLGGYEMFTEQEEAIFAECRDVIPHFNQQMGRITGHSEVYQVVDERLPRFGFAPSVRHLILNQPEGQVNTGQMMATLLQLARHHGVEVYNGFEIKHLEDDGQGVRLETAAGWTLRVPQALVCTNGFATRLLPHLAVVPARNQVLVTQPIPGLPVEGCFHYDRGYFYFRNIDGRLLVGGGRNLDFKTEQTDDFGANTLIRNALLDFLHTVICPRQQVEVDLWWTGILGLGPVKRPIVERVSPHLSVAVRMSGMGVAIGTLVGQEGAELLVNG